MKSAMEVPQTARVPRFEGLRNAGVTVLWFAGKLGPVWAVLAAFAVGAIVLDFAGISPAVAYRAMIEGAFGDLAAIGLTLQKSVPLILAGTGVAIALRCGLFNIGAEGQLYIGALFGTVVALYVRGLPPLLHVSLALVAAFVGGGIWGAIPGYLRAARGVSEIITTIMLNYIAFWFVSFLVHGPIQEPAGYYPQTELVPTSSFLPIFWPQGRLHAGFLVAVGVAVIGYILLFHTTLGLRIRAVGAGIQAARHAGIAPVRNMVIAMTISGGLAGLAGINEILGVQHRLSDFFSPGYGYDAIAVALLGYANPLGVIVAAIFFGALRSGSNMMQRSVGVPAAVAGFIQGLTVLFVVIARAIPEIQRRSPRSNTSESQVAQGGGEVAAS
jgi:general nucleoside transport system permease protein